MLQGEKQLQKEKKLQGEKQNSPILQPIYPMLN
jgi:hypothetical protein